MIMKGISPVPPGQKSRWKLVSPKYSGEKHTCLPVALARKSIVPGEIVDLMSTVSMGSRRTASLTWPISQAPFSPAGVSTQIIDVRHTADWFTEMVGSPDAYLRHPRPGF